MHKSQQVVYSRNYKEWISVTRHRAGSRTDPNAMHFDGYFHGSSGIPVPMTRRVGANGVEKDRRNGTYVPPGAYEEGDVVQIRVKDPASVASFYVRYNQIKELLVNLNDFVNLRSIGFRRNYVENLGHQDLSNLRYLTNVDYSDNGSLTQITFHPDAPIDFFYLQGTNIPQSNIDYMIQHAVNSGILNGTMSYSGRPSYDMWEEYDLLASRGWQLSLSPLAGTIDKLGDTSAGVSNGALIKASHRIAFRAMNADGTVRHSGNYSDMHPGDLPDFEENGWIETEYYQPSILHIEVPGKQLKTLFLQHMVNLEWAIFPSNDIVSVSLAGMTKLQKIDFRYNPLSSISGITDAALTDIELRDTNLGSTAIDSILADLVSEGRLNGSFRYSVKPNPSSAANYDTLISRGWFLSIEPDRVPADFTLTATVNSSVVDLSWTAAVGADYYKVYRRLSGASTWSTINSNWGGTTFTSDTVQEGQTYDFRIGAVNSFGETFSNIETETMPSPVAAPVITFTSKTANSLRVDWASTGATNYKAYSREWGSNTWVLRFTLSNTATAFTFTGLTSGMTYELKVDAVDASGTEYPSNIIVEAPTATVLPSAQYYLSANGSDSNNGTSESTPWKTLAKLNSVFIENDSAGISTTWIHLRRGDTFTGTLRLQNGYNVRAYGDTNLPKPIISSGDANGAIFRNLRNFEVRDVVFQGSGATTNQGRGIWAINDQPGNTKLDNLWLVNCEAHGYKYEGILIEGANVKSGFELVRILGCTVSDILRDGIVSKGVFDYQSTLYAHHDVIVFGCEVSNCYGDAAKTSGHSGNGIMLSDVYTGSIYQCVAHDCAINSNSSAGGAVGIWFWDSDTVLINDCEAYNISSGLTNKDGAGFDLDGGVTNGVIERCYSHDNDGGGVIIGQFEWARPMDNIVVRHNISINDAKKYSASLYLFSGETNVGNIEIYNNVFYQSSVAKAVYSRTVWAGGSVGTVNIRNNVFIGALPTFTGVTQSNNWFSSMANPQFVNPASLVPDGFKLQATSPLIDAGAEITLPFTVEVSQETDFFGNIVPLGTVRDIGAHQAEAVPTGVLDITNPSEGEYETNPIRAMFNDNEASVPSITSPTEGSTTGSTIKITFNG